jgi:Tol biopolymer transport system component
VDQHWKVNPSGTYGYQPSPVTDTAEQIIYQRVRKRASNLYLYDLSTRVTKALPAKVNSLNWEYWAVASQQYVFFMRLTSKQRQLLLYNRTTRALAKIATTMRKCVSCLDPSWVGASHAVYTQCSAKTGACNVKIWQAGTITSVPTSAAPVSQYGGVLDETSATCTTCGARRTAGSS